MTLELQIADISGNMLFAVPYMTVDPIKEKLRSGMQIDMMAVDPQWLRRLSSGVMETPMEAVVEMGNANITLRELLELMPGDTIMLDRPSTSEMLVKIEEVPKFYGIPGLINGNKAIQISKIYNTGGQS
jgi:flagellar motor switch protein FliM